MATAIDSLLLAVAVLSQIGGTALLLQHSTWGQNLAEISRCGIVAAITAAFVSFLRFVLNWRSKRQVGDWITIPGRLFAFYSSIGLCGVVMLTFKESYTIERLWVGTLFTIAAFCVADLTRTVDVLFYIVVQYPVYKAIWKTKELLFWRIGIFIIISSFHALMVIRECQFADLKKARVLREKEATGEVKKVSGEVKKAEHE